MALAVATGLMLHLVGFFEELGSSDHYRGTIRDAVRMTPAADEERLVEYLQDGHVLLDVPETPKDVISGDDRIVGAPSLVSDGSWLWRLDLPYYLARYHLALPQDFLDHVSARDFRVPQLSEEVLEHVTREALPYF